MNRLFPLLALGVVVPVSAATIVAGPNVQVSAARGGDTHYEVLVAADPKDPKKLIVGSFLFPDSNTEGSTVVYASGDSGITWEPTLGGNALLETSDPAVAFGPRGEAYYLAAHLPDQGRKERTMLFYRSPDGGKTWDKPGVFTYTDREYITVDTTGGKNHGRIYVNGNNRVPRGVSDIVMFYSADEGRTWVGPGKREGFGRFTAGQMGNGVVASDGTFIAIIGETGRVPGNVLSATTSVDGGATFTPAVTIDQFVVGGNRKGARNNVNAQPILAIDPGSGKFRDRLYAVWPDRRAGKSEIYFASSSDKGATWTKGRAINDNPAADKTDQLMPTVAVNPHGVVGVMWYDRREHPDNMGWDARFTASVDGGATFLPSVKISEGSTHFDATMRWTALRPNTQRGVASKQKEAPGQAVQVSLNTFLFMGGDTAGIAATADGVFHPVWVDSRTGTPQVWTAAIRVGPEVKSPAPDAALAKLDDISSASTLELSQPRFDRANNVLTAVARVVNTSSQALQGPFRVRVTALTSALGDLTVTNADNNVDGVGADWAFTDAKLEAGASSDPRIVRFKLSNLRPFEDQNRYRLGLLDLNFVVLGRAP
ncbi:MAG TPA: sialidase family protein [Opitutaceae bacterium]|nr:sialidase family protein [Opitutaceae bacterium]